ncbi:MAG TPA: helix-turn-helix domain-containing protein [Bdellovibrionales bacterium]|nr:helix-turn-helix domain-containing protein [Bdellovibrionales bacterium]
MEMESFLKEFGKALKTTRKQMGLSQVTAAQDMRIDYRHYQNIEGGKINLRLDTLIKLVKFYHLDKKDRPFNMDSALDLLSGYKDSNAHDNWQAIYQHFVEGGHAGYVVINCNTKGIERINEKLFKTLGHRAGQELIGKPVQQLMVPESAAQFDELIAHHVTEQVSKPFIVTFRTQPPAFPIPMMAVVQAKRDVGATEDKLHCIFFDRKTLEEEGHRLKDILNGYQQFMELYPQLRAV